jgi:hypothetical protein
MKAWQYSGGAQAKFRELAGRHGAVEELTGGCWTKPREINALLEMVPQAGPLILWKISGLRHCWTPWFSIHLLGFFKKCPMPFSEALASGFKGHSVEKVLASKRVAP